MPFTTTYKIASADDAETLAAMDYVSANYGNSVIRGVMTGALNLVELELSHESYADSKAAIMAMKTEFTTRLEEYNIEMNIVYQKRWI